MYFFVKSLWRGYFTKERSKVGYKGFTESGNTGDNPKEKFGNSRIHLCSNLFRMKPGRRLQKISPEEEN